MLTLLGVAGLELLLWLMAKPEVDLPDAMLAALVVAAVFAICRVSWIEISKGWGFANHAAFAVAVLWVLIQVPSYLTTLTPIYTALEPAALAGLLLTAILIILPYGLMIHPVLDGVSLVYRSGRWRRWR